MTMNIRETTVSKLQQLPEPLLQAVSDFIDFILLNYQAHDKNGGQEGQDTTHLVHLDDEASTIGERWEKWFAEVDQNSDRFKTNKERIILVQEMKQLFRETQAIHADCPLTDEEIAAEIAAYRRGE